MRASLTCIRSVFQSIGISKSGSWNRSSYHHFHFCTLKKKYYGDFHHKRKFSQDLTKTPDDHDPGLEWLRSGKEYLSGPDQIIPSSALYTWDIRGAVRISTLGNEPNISRPPISIPSMFLRRVNKVPNAPALAVKRDGRWKKWTLEKYYNDSCNVAKGFIALGLEKYSSVCILSFNSPEWFMSNMGAIFAGGISTGIYTTNSAESCAYIAEDSSANIYVVEDEQQLSKILQYRDQLPHLKAIIQCKGEPSIDGVLSWKELLELGAKQSDEMLNKRLKQAAVNQCCTLIYTSGTTGKPKGVMLSHDNVTWLAHEAAAFADVERGVHDIVSFLPLSHVAAQHTDIYMPIFLDSMVYFADPDALKGTLINTLREVQPSFFLAVPRVWEKFYERLKEIGRENTGLKLKISNWVKQQAFECNTKRIAGDPNPETLKFKIADKLVLSKVRHALGFSRNQMAMTAAAPINIDILNYFLSLNIIIGEAYGLSECAGPHTLSHPGKNIVRFGSIGKCLDGVATKLDRVTADGEGEICLGGRHVFMGYLHQKEKTMRAIDKEGWLHTEDLGRIDKDGFVFVTGRLKELLITAGGENVAPVPIEENIKRALPCLSNAMVIGDKFKFLSVLITFKTEMNPQTNEPLEQLTKQAKLWVEKHGECTVNTVKDVLDEVYKKSNSKLTNAITAGITLANSKSVSRASKVRKWVILPRDFSIPGGELGPTLKLRRSVVIEKYKDIVNDIYKDGLDPNSAGALG